MQEIATHEGGHAAIAFSCGETIAYAAVDTYCGEHHGTVVDPPAIGENAALIALGGVGAEISLVKRALSRRAVSSDLKTLKDARADSAFPGGISDVELMRAVLRFFDEPRALAATSDLASALAKHRWLDGADATEILARNLGPASLSR